MWRDVVMVGLIVGIAYLVEKRIQSLEKIIDSDRTIIVSLQNKYENLDKHVTALLKDREEHESVDEGIKKAIEDIKNHMYFTSETSDNRPHPLSKKNGNVKPTV